MPPNRKPKAKAKPVMLLQSIPRSDGGFKRPASDHSSDDDHYSIQQRLNPSETATSESTTESNARDAHAFALQVLKTVNHEVLGGHFSTKRLYEMMDLIENSGIDQIVSNSVGNDFASAFIAYKEKTDAELAWLREQLTELQLYSIPKVPTSTTSTQTDQTVQQTVTASTQTDPSTVTISPPPPTLPKAMPQPAPSPSRAPATRSYAAATRPPPYPPQHHHLPMHPPRVPQLGVQRTATERKQFRLLVPSDHFCGLSGPTLSKAIDTFLHSHLPGALFSIIDAQRLKDRKTGVSRILIFVGTLTEAEALVRHRHAFKGTKYSLHDVLSEDEQRAHDLLWPTFQAARVAHDIAQFHRGRLFVKGVEILPVL